MKRNQSRTPARKNNTRPNADEWRSFFHFRKGESVTLGLPFAAVLIALVLANANWSTAGLHNNGATFLSGSIGTTVLSGLMKIWKR